MFVDLTGAVGYTAPHSASIPLGAIVTGFVYTPAGPGGSFGDFSFGGHGATGLLACPATGGSYQVFANIESFNETECLGFDSLTQPANSPSAWEYTGTVTGEVEMSSEVSEAGMNRVGGFVDAQLVHPENSN